MRLDFVYIAEDWVALYKDGELLYEAHSISGIELAGVLGLECHTHDYLDIEEELWGDLSPRYFSDIRFK